MIDWIWGVGRGIKDDFGFQSEQPDVDTDIH